MFCVKCPRFSVLFAPGCPMSVSSWSVGEARLRCFHHHHFLLITLSIIRADSWVMKNLEPDTRYLAT